MPVESPLLATLRASGATSGEFLGALLPANFGDFRKEYDAALTSAGLVDTNYRAVFSFTGPDGQRYLNALLTCNVRDRKPGEGVAGLLLNPQGHILAVVETLLTEKEILVLVHAIVRERTFQTFDKFIIMDDVTLEDLTGAWGTLDVVGPKAAAVLVDAAKLDIAPLAVLSHAEVQIGAARCRVVRRVRFGQAAATIFVPRDEMANVWRHLETHARAHGGIPVGMDAIETLRIEAGNPWFGEDFDDKEIPHEAGLEISHISYDKGCYTGQEIVERVRSRGHANRRLTSLQFDGPEAPPPGTKLLADGKEIGNVTSSRFSPLLNRAIGLGYVRREFLGIGTRLDASGTPAEVIVPPRK